jgi:hypothetical protein
MYPVWNYFISIIPGTEANQHFYERFQAMGYTVQSQKAPKARKKIAYILHHFITLLVNLAFSI